MDKGKNDKGAGMRCCVPSCPSSSRKNRSINYYPFPRKRKIKEEWIRALTEAELYGKIVGSEGPGSLSRLFICSRHFTDAAFQRCPSPTNGTKGNARKTEQGGAYTQTQRSLKDDAVPSILIENTIKRRSSTSNCNGTPTVRHRATRGSGSLMSKNAEVPISTVALRMKEAVTTFNIALQNFKGDKEQNTSKSQKTTPPELPSVIGMNSISIRTTRSTKRPEQKTPPQRAIVKLENKQVQSRKASKSCSPQFNVEKRVTRTSRMVPNNVSHELTQCTSPPVAKLVSNLKAETPVKQSPMKSVRSNTTVRSGTKDDPSVKSLVTRRSSRKSAPPTVYDSKLLEIATQLLRPKADVKPVPLSGNPPEIKTVTDTKVETPASAPAVRTKKAKKKIVKPASILNNKKADKIVKPTSFFKIRKTIRKAKNSLASSSFRRPTKAAVQKLMRPSTNSEDLMSDDEGRKQFGFVQSMFSQVITKVFTDPPTLPLPRGRRPKTKDGRDGAVIRNGHASSSDGCDNGIRLFGGKRHWGIDEDDGVMNGHRVYRNNSYRSMSLSHRQILDMNVEYGEDEDGGAAEGLFLNNGSSRSIKMDAVDIDENEYGTPLLNGFGFDIDSNHDALENDLRNGHGKEILPEGCEYPSDASESADDNYYALIPTVEVNEVESSDSFSDGQAFASQSNGLKTEVDDTARLTGDAPLQTETEVCER